MKMFVFVCHFVGIVCCIHGETNIVLHILPHYVLCLTLRSQLFVYYYLYLFLFIVIAVSGQILG
jgi:hypothetical protein